MSSEMIQTVLHDHTALPFEKIQQPSEPTPGDSRETTTYSMWSLFRNCRRACYWRYVKQIVPVNRKVETLWFGSLIHECLEIWHGKRELEPVLDHIDRSCVNRDAEPSVKRDWQYARAMMIAYAEKYPTEPFEVVGLEQVFTADIVNPATGAKSRSFVMSGKIDGLLRKPDGTYWLLENKTASSVGGSYIDRLWLDTQIRLYAHYVREALGIPVVGSLYNVLTKTRLAQSVGETEQEFEERRAILAKKNKTGRSSAKRKYPETDDEFQARLLDWYARNDAFLRVELLFDQDDFEILRSEIWELSKNFLSARRRGAWYQNTDYCFRWNRQCSYFPICNSKDNPLVVENEYELKPAHSELQDQPNPSPTF